MLITINLENGSYSIVEADTVDKAETWARYEFGNRNVRSSAEATKEEIDWYQAWNGIIHQPHEIPIAP